MNPKNIALTSPIDHAKILDEASDPLVTLNSHYQFTYANKAFAQVLGEKRDAIIGKDLWGVYSKDGADMRRDAIKEVFETGQTKVIETIVPKPSGDLYFIMTYKPIFNEQEIIISVVAIAKNITDRKQAEEQIQHMAYHDSLTGLPNRKLFSDRLDIALAHSRRNKKEVGIAMLDLDNFKDVNDTLGHAAGDLLIKAAAERLTAALRKGDTVARIGGDEFVLILPDLKIVEDAIQVAQKIVESFRKPFFIDTHQLVVTTSIGIAVYPNDGMDGDILLKNADIAMYQAKEAGRDRYQIYNKA